MSALEELRARIEQLAETGRTAPWGGEASLERSSGRVAGAARTLRGLYLSTTSIVLLQRVRAGALDGLAIVVAEGNYKDEATLLAASAVAAAFADSLERPLLAEVDVLGAVRRAVLESHDRVWALSELPIAHGLFGTSLGPRSTLRGIGASVAVAVLLPPRAWLTAVGECPIWLLRDGAARRLSLPHTLANDPGYREAIARDPARAIDYADAVLLKGLGLTARAPEFDVTRLDLHPCDRIVLGNEWLATHVEAVALRAHEQAASNLCARIAAAIEAEPAPIPVSVAVGAVGEARDPQR